MARGRWQGGEFDTGHRENGTLATINWFGKTFISATDAKPLICLDADGNKYANTDNGEASLSMAEFRGEVTATMVFDGQPVHDHFKKIDDNAVMGIMNGKNALDDVAGVDLGHLGAPQAGLGGQPHHQCDAASNMSAPTTTSAPMRSQTGTNSNAVTTTRWGTARPAPARWNTDDDGRGGSGASAVLAVDAEADEALGWTTTEKPDPCRALRSHAPRAAAGQARSRERQGTPRSHPWRPVKGTTLRLPNQAQGASPGV
jgi:hypothetical protein